MSMVDVLAGGAPPKTQATPTTSSRRLGDIGLLLPSILLVVGVFGLPLAIMFWQAFSDPELGFGNFAWYLGDSVQRSVLLRTFTTGLEVTVICLVLGYPYAYAMVAFGPTVRIALTLIVLVPFWTSLMVRTFAWVILLEDGGPMQTLLSVVGLGDVPLLRTNLGVVIGMSQILLPFMVLPLYAVMSGIDRRLVLASSSLGARPVISFVRIWVPLSLPGVGAGCLMVFISSLGFYVTPALLGAPDDALISQQIYVQVTSLLAWGRGGAMGVVLLLVTFLVLAVLMYLMRRNRKERTA
ncbi:MULTISPECIES: ABC transporter permease [unclassified Mycolicibacterium]|uniref:ABC transporter permease n=1 Tax=unclassified Mycolicibacterium TaxID=2636767 RepID=UPI0012DC03D3|nr:MULTISPECIES: ABC transporter permease [unclassified Mycolicibacterium]MUL81155.1 ABC transporter permease [Mycolicibacterium sp. CBMA 329]MUL86921.1 ABC transporter permease [Mycolicibacterium sp. CBMA 331]MUL98795.1 ABC transporter permease [Mycolicibacterium sp. CBMA 334]MUM25654.1 ABC transporter permease [Mycolicibacterium sp. CBMA 295]MUM37218.1 ABC transporter permease [Mycolicibacterium sp. CBMA 247]